MDTHAEFDALFAKAMDSVEALVGDSFAKDFDWGRFEGVIDVGGSKGAKTLTILKQHSGLQALVVDREQVIRDARRIWSGKEDATLVDRMDFERGDLLDSVPTATSDRDIDLLSAMLHGFDDETCIRVLNIVADAARPKGACIAVMELVLPEQRVDLARASFDLQMFVGTRGRERTLREWKTLITRSGLFLEQIVSLRSLGKIIVLRPAMLSVPSL